MKYISIGEVVAPSTEHILKVAHCGMVFTLTGDLARLWLDGRFGFACSENPLEHKAADQLRRMELIVPANPYGAGEYRALTKCVLVPAKCKNHYTGLSSEEKEILLWIREAGLRLTIAELIFLRDHGIKPTMEYLGKENRQRLVERLYTIDTIFDNLMEDRMELCKQNSSTVKIVLSLLRKKRIILL